MDLENNVLIAAVICFIALSSIASAQYNDEQMQIYRLHKYVDNYNINNQYSANYFGNNGYFTLPAREHFVWHSNGHDFIISYPADLRYFGDGNFFFHNICGLNQLRNRGCRKSQK